MAKKTKPNKYLKFLILTLVGISTIIFIISITYGMSNRITKPHQEKIISGSFDESKSKSEDEWREILTAEQFHILREKGTDIPFTKDLTDNKEIGTYVSVGCDEPVFTSEDKFDSGTGWPSFTKPISEDSLVLREDYELGYKRIEVLDKCGGHLGHLFEDGPQPTGLRYCINATVLKFIPDK